MTLFENCLVNVNKRTTLRALRTEEHARSDAPLEYSGELLLALLINADDHELVPYEVDHVARPRRPRPRRFTSKAFYTSEQAGLGINRQDL
jgi:hypothetical protein